MWYLRIPPQCQHALLIKTWYRWGVDPLAHTLVGASLAETGLKQKTAWGTLTLMIAANLPDIDGVCMLGGQDAGLAGRRGITHGVLAWLVLPVVLAAIIHTIAKRVQRKREVAAKPKHLVSPVGAQPALSFGWLLVLSVIGVLSHPLLDWMNSYGVRLLMPFSSTWFYGDALFIIDPVLWLLAGAAVVFAHGKTKVAAALWLILLAAATAIIIVPVLAPPPAKMLWCIGAGLLVYLRVRGKPPSSKITARVCLAILTLYIGAMVMGTANARTKATQWLSQHNLSADQLVVNPMAARPFSRDVIARVGQTYHFLQVPAFGNEPVSPTNSPLPVGEKSREVIAALAIPQVQGAVKWMRLPAYEQAPTSEGVVVTIMDVRYSRMRNTKLGRTQVWLDNKLNVIQVRP